MVMQKVNNNKNLNMKGAIGTMTPTMVAKMFKIPLIFCLNYPCKWQCIPTCNNMFVIGLPYIKSICLSLTVLCFL
jgi:hypothetical protein